MVICPLLVIFGIILSFGSMVLLFGYCNTKKTECQAYLPSRAFLTSSASIEMENSFLTNPSAPALWMCRTGSSPHSSAAQPEVIQPPYP
jgi:hypothetical protein